MSPAARWCSASAALALVVAVAAVLSIPAGAAQPAGTLPEGARLAASHTVGDLEVLVAVHEGRLLTVIAFPGRRGWHGVDLDPVPVATVAAVSATPGAGPVPPVTAVYGRVPGAEVVLVRWEDGTRDEVPPARDGTYVAAREGLIGVAGVRALAGDGPPVAEVTP